MKHGITIGVAPAHFLSTQVAQAKLGVSGAMARILARDGRVAAVKKSRSRTSELRFDPESIAAYLAAQATSDVLSTIQAARVMNVDPSYVGILFRRGKLRGEKRGGRLFINRDAAQAFTRTTPLRHGRQAATVSIVKARRVRQADMQSRSLRPDAARIGILGRIEASLDDVKAALARLEQFWS